MAGIKFRGANTWCDPCLKDVRLNKNGIWYRVKDGDYYFDGTWKRINCAQPAKWLPSDSFCENEPCIMSLTFDVVASSPTTASVTCYPIDGLAPFIFAWSNGQTGQTATNLVRDTQYTVTVTDARGCIASGTVTPNIDILRGLKVEMMYFARNTTVTTDPYYPRLGAIGAHQCNLARFDVLANNVSQGIANLNNAGGTDAPPGNDDQNRPPGYPGSYDNADLLDRYWSKTLTGADAAAIAGPGGKVTFTLSYTGVGFPHSDACWIRITKDDGTILASATVNAFTSYIFDPYA